MRLRPFIAVAALLCAGILIASAGTLRAECKRRGGFAVHQCGDRGWFEPPPEGSGAVRAVFWQIGYGNEMINNGEGSNGTGVAPAGFFSGNDSGLWEVPLLEAVRKAN